MNDAQRLILDATREQVKEIKESLDNLEMFLTEEPRTDDQKLEFYEHAIDDFNFRVDVILGNLDQVMKDTPSVETN